MPENTLLVLYKLWADIAAIPMQELEKLANNRNNYTKADNIMINTFYKARMDMLYIWTPAMDDELRERIKNMRQS